MWFTIRSKLSLLLMLGFVVFSLPVHAESSSDDLTSLSLEVLMELSVYGASKFEQKVEDAPSSVSIINADEIRKYGYRTLADILRSIRGFYITYDRNYHYVGVRGFNRPGDYNTRILLLIDGHRLNDNIFNQASIGTDFPMDLDLIDRIEIIRGPGSSLYGDNAFFAVVNVITRNNLKGGEVSGSISSHETGEGRLSWGGKSESGIDMMVSGSIMDSRGTPDLYFKEFDNPFEHKGIAGQSDYDRSHSFFTKLSVRNFTLAALYASRTKGIPTAPFETVFNDPRERTRDRHGYIDLKYQHAFERELEVMARIYYNYFDYSGDYIYEMSDLGFPHKVINKDAANGEQLGAELLITRKLLENHKVSAGIEMRDNIRQQQRTYNESPYLKILDDNRQSATWAVYLQDEFRIRKDLIFSGGVRYDFYHEFGSTINPRLALLYKPFDSTTFKILYGRAFRAPNVFELYYDAREIGQKSNPDLKPEKIETFELVYEQQLGKHYRYCMSGFYNKSNDLISQAIDPADGLLVFRNSQEVKAKGMELELEGKWLGGFQSRLSYTFIKTMDTETGRAMTNSPSHLAKLNVTAPLKNEKIFLGIEEQYMSRRKTLDGNNAKANYITNVTIFSRDMLKNMEISASVYNLFDYAYGDPGAEEHRQDIIGQDGRSFRLKLTYRF